MAFLKPFILEFLSTLADYEALSGLNGVSDDVQPAINIPITENYGWGETMPKYSANTTTASVSLLGRTSLAGVSRINRSSAVEQSIGVSPWVCSRCPISIPL